MALESIIHFGPPSDPTYLSDLALKRGYDPNGNQDNLALIDTAAKYLVAQGIEPPVELEVARSQLELRWYSGELVRWLDVPAPAEEPTMSASDRLGARFMQLYDWADGGADKLALVTAPMRNEADEVGKFFDALTAVSPKYPIAAVVVGDSLTSDGSLDEVYRRHGNVARAAVRGIGPARDVAFQHLHDPNVSRTRFAPEKEFYWITDVDADCHAGITDTYIDAFSAPGNEHKLMATGAVNYSFLWEDQPYVDGFGKVIVPGDDTGEQARAFTADDVAFIRTYRDPQDPQRIHVKDFPSYQFFTAAQSISECVSGLGYNIADYIRGERCAMLPGPNTCIRGTLLEQLDDLPAAYSLQPDGRYEMHHLAVVWQNLYDFREVGIALGSKGDAVVNASERSIVGTAAYIPRRLGELSMSRLTTERLVSIRQGGVKPYKVELGPDALDQRQSLARALADLRRIGNIFA